MVKASNQHNNHNVLIQTPENIIIKLKAYLPLMVVVGFSIIFAITHDGSLFQVISVIHYAMGYFLCLLAMFKLFDINGFADGFQMYDLVAKRCRKYAYCYPSIELSLGIGYLTNFMPFIINLITVLVMLVSSIGIIKSIRSGMNIKCACLGTVLSVPLSTVSIIENVGMGLMASGNLLFLIMY